MNLDDSISDVPMLIVDSNSIGLRKLAGIIGSCSSLNSSNYSAERSESGNMWKTTGRTAKVETNSC